jgi:sugar phosphate isomerase/epimerase
MQRVLSTHLFANQKLTTALLDQLQDAEFSAIEIFCARQHLDYRNRNQIAESALWFRNSQMRVHSLHSPMFTDEYWGKSGFDTAITITEPVKAKRIPMIDEIKRTLEIAETIPYRYLIQHLGVAGESFGMRAVDAAVTSLEELMIFARHRGVEILLENIPNELSSAEGLLHFVELTRLDLNVCLDLGHAHLNEGVANAYNSLRPRIRSTHVHDNDKEDDLHLFPFDGTIDWAQAMTCLRSEAGQYPLLMEPMHIPDLEATGVPFKLDEVRKVFDRLEEVRVEYD